MEHKWEVFYNTMSIWTSLETLIYYLYISVCFSLYNYCTFVFIYICAYIVYICITGESLNSTHPYWLLLCHFKSWKYDWLFHSLYSTVRSIIGHPEGLESYELEASIELPWLAQSVKSDWLDVSCCFGQLDTTWLANCKTHTIRLVDGFWLVISNAP